VKKTSPKKMTLSRETLGALSDKEMKDILGGDRPVTYGSKDVCCV
jgi:natural product precursor